MQLGLKIGVGVVAAAVVAHAGYWWLGTQEMKRQLDVYAVQAQGRGQTFTYEASAAGYPWAQELRLRNIVLAGKTGQGSTVFKLDDGVVIHAGNGITDKQLTVMGDMVPFSLQITKAGSMPKQIAVKGQIGRMDVASPLVWNPNVANTMTSRLTDIAFTDAGGKMAVRIPVVNQTATMSPENQQSLDYKMQMDDMTIDGQDVVLGKPVTSNATVKSVGVAVAVTGVSTSMPVTQKMVFKVNGITLAKTMPQAEAGKPVLDMMSVADIGFTMDTLEREGFLDYLMKFKMSGVTMPQEAGSMVGDIKDVTCSLSYNNVPKPLIAELAKQNEPATAAPTQADSQRMVGLIVEAMVKDKLTMGVDQCKIVAKSLNADLKGMVGASADGYPNIMLRLKAQGDAVVGLNAMKGMFVPAAEGEAAAPADVIDVSVLTISNTLVLDGKPVMPLPPLAMLGGMVAPALPVAPGQ